MVRYSKKPIFQNIDSQLNWSVECLGFDVLEIVKVTKYIVTHPELYAYIMSVVDEHWECHATGWVKLNIY